MWKLYFEYSDGGKITVTGKGDITPQKKENYIKRYGSAQKAILQRYPKIKYAPEVLWDLSQN